TWTSPPITPNFNTMSLSPNTSRRWARTAQITCGRLNGLSAKQNPNVRFCLVPFRKLRCIFGTIFLTFAFYSPTISPWQSPGRSAAGQPIEAIETPETISLADFVRSKEVFVLEVRGDSMRDEAILDGDYVLIEKVKTAQNGDIVVALVEGTDATLKRFYHEGE